MKYIYNKVYDEDVFLYNEFVLLDDNNIPISRKDKQFKRHTSALHKLSQFVVDRMHSIIRTYDMAESIVIDKYLSEKMSNVSNNIELMNPDGTALLINISADCDNNILRRPKLKLSAVDYQLVDKIYPNYILERRLENISLINTQYVMYIKHSLKNAIAELIEDGHTDKKFRLDVTDNILNIVTDNILTNYMK